MGQVLLKALISLITRLLASLASEKLLEWVFFKIADAIAANTKTPYDNEFVNKLKEVWDEGKESNRVETE